MTRYVSSALRWFFGVVVMAFWATAIGVASLFGPPKRLHKLWKFGFRMITNVAGLRITVKGLENIDPSRGYLYMCNHTNLFEPFVGMIAVPQWIVAVEKASNFKLPFYGLLIRRWGNIPIVRENIHEALQALEVAKSRLVGGDCIAIMPEGTRSRSGKLGPFKKGAFHLAVDAGATIVPMVFKGLHNYNQHGSWLVNPCDVEVIFMPPIEAGEYTKDQLPALMARVRAQILEALDQVEDEQASGIPAAPSAS